MIPLVELKWKSVGDEETSKELLETAMKTLVQNIMSVVAVAALVHGGPVIQPKHAATAVDYFHRKCPLEGAVQTGGSPLPATYFGGVEPMYSALNPSGGSTETIDFVGGVARAEIAQTGGAGGASGGARLGKSATTWVHHELQIYKDHHRVSVSKGAKEQLTKLILRYITCLNHDLQKKQPLTAKKVRDVLKKKSYKAFH
jgi:hypothetical protein